LKNITIRNILFFAAIGFMYFAGVIAILYPMASNVYSLVNSRTTIAEYDKVVEKMDDTDIKSIFAKADKYNADVYKHMYHDGLEKCLCDDKGLMCYVDIPCISVYLPVYYGTSNEVLQKGCGYIENTSLPVGGKSTHSVISGHTGLPTAEMFTKLDQVVNGDIFYIHVLDRVLAYKIDKITVVYPDVVTDLAIVKDKDYVTLLTCTPYGVNDKRLLVRGTRIPYEAPKKEETAATSVSADKPADTELDKEITHQITVVIAIAIVSVLLYIFALIWLISSIKKKPTDESEGQDVTQKTD